MSYAMAAPLLRDIWQAMMNRTVDTTETSQRSTIEGHFRFAHAETVLPLASLLGYLQGDRPLKSSSIDESRIFRSSIVAPFSANIGFTLYECQDNKNVNGDDAEDSAVSHVVEMTVNEKQIPLQKADYIFYPLGTWVEELEPWIHQWSFQNKYQKTHKNS